MLQVLVERLNELIIKFLDEYEVKKLQSFSIDIENCISDLFIEVDDKFVTILITKFFKPIHNYIEFVENNPIGKSHSRLKQKNQQEEKLKLVYGLRNSILNDYKEQLFETDFFKKYTLEKSSVRDFIINPDYNGLPIEAIPTSVFKKVLSDSCSETLKYFKKQSDTKEIEHYKNELFIFFDGVKQKKQKLINSIIKLEDDIYRIEKEVENDKHYKIDLLFDKQQELINYNNHKEVLDDIIKQLSNSHLVLKTYEENEPIPLTVFGHRDYEKMNCFFTEFQFLLDNKTSKSDFFKLFSHSNSKPKAKVNLANAQQQELVLMIKKMKVFFIDEIKKKGSYYQWWVDRFLFNGEEKTTTYLSKKSGGIDVEKFMSKRYAISQIIQSLE